MHWSRAIILVDMNAFFASVEQYDHPELRGRPIGITNGAQGTCIITCSYEARAHGIKTGMRLREARQILPDFIQIPARPERYAEVSTAIMESLTRITPDVEIFSVDEAFLDVTHCQALHGSPAQMGHMARQQVYEASGLLCSVGVSGDKTTAKFAAKLHKPNGLTVIPPWQARERLASARLTELCGVAKGIGGYLEERGIEYCGQMAQLPISELGRRFGNPGRRIWYMAQGLDPEPVCGNVAAPKSVGHGKVMPPATTDREVILTFLHHMAFKVAARLRRHQLRASSFFIGLRAKQGWLGERFQTVQPTASDRQIGTLCQRFVRQCWQGEAVAQVQITALDPRPAQALQLDLFATAPAGEQQRQQAQDAVNERYGEYSLVPARLLKRSQMPNVIAPAWKPHGHRKTV